MRVGFSKARLYLLVALAVLSAQSLTHLKLPRHTKLGSANFAPNRSTQSHTVSLSGYC